MYIIWKKYPHTHALESPKPQRNLGQTQEGEKNDRPIPYNPPRCWTPRASISACSFWRSDFCLGKKCTGDFFRWSRAASGKGCIYIWHFCKQLTSLTNKKSILKSPPILPDIIPEKNNTLSGNPIWYAPHAPTLIATTTFLAFCCDVVLCDSNTSHFYNNKVDSRFKGSQGSLTPTSDWGFDKLLISSTTAFLRGESQSSNGGK